MVLVTNYPILSTQLHHLHPKLGTQFNEKAQVGNCRSITITV